MSDRPLPEALRRRIEAEFTAEDRDEVVAELEAITLDHVMARSPTNLENTRTSVLDIAEGDLDKLRRYAARARVDFRDVIMWADQKREASR